MRPKPVNGNLEEIKNLNVYFQEQSTIEDDLKKVSVDNKTIMATHSPPKGYGLDVCSDGRRIGSKSILNWIVKEQPLLCLCGHIHESPKMNSVWKTKIGDTIVIQPGQEKNNTIMTHIKIDREITIDRILL
jgi:Icc-related predicted phosphoesterase